MDKKNVNFNIIKAEKGHKPNDFGMGALSLESISPVIINVEEGTATVDVGALHARSTVEKGIKFFPSKDEVPNANPFWLVWVTVDKNQQHSYYAGVTACEMTIDREARRGYKSLPEHVNRMDKSMKRQIIVAHMDKKSKQILKDFLIKHSAEMWNNSSEQLKNELE